jgi:hypothetical protein
MNHTPINGASGVRIIDLMYTDYHITPVFDIQAGSFSSYGGGTLKLGDGEEMVFYLNIAELNAEPSNVKIEWIPPPAGSSLDVREKKDGGHIILSTEGTNRYRIRHDTDYAPTDEFYLITRDLYYVTDEYKYVLTGISYYPYYDENGIPVQSVTRMVSGGYDNEGHEVYIYVANGPIYTNLRDITPQMPAPVFYRVTSSPDSEGYTYDSYYSVTVTRTNNTYQAKNKEGITRWAVDD